MTASTTQHVTPLQPASSGPVLQDAPLPQTGQWFVLHTRSRQEKIVAADLAAMHIDCFLPLMHHTRLYGRRKVRVELPMFPGYLFLRGTLDQVYSADRTRRVASIIQVTDQARLDWELRNIHLALHAQAPLDPYPHLTTGVRAEVISGPFRGLQGIVESRTKLDRLILQVQMLGRGVSIEIDGAVLQPID